MHTEQLNKYIEADSETLTLRTKELEEAFEKVADLIADVAIFTNKSIKNNVDEPEIKVELSHDFQLLEVVESPLTFDLLRNGDFDLFEDGSIARRYGKLAVCKTIKLTLSKINHASFSGNPFRVTGATINAYFVMSSDGQGLLLATLPKYEYLPPKYEWTFGGHFAILMEELSEIVKVKNKDKKRQLDFDVNISAIAYVFVRFLLAAGWSSESQTELSKSFLVDASQDVNSEMREIEECFCIEI